MIEATDVAKLLPAFFAAAVITSVYFIYTFQHLIPLLQLNVNPTERNQNNFSKGLWQSIVFNFLSLMVTISFLRSIFTNPGSIPDTADWHFGSDCPNHVGPPIVTLELKENGERRTCKFCQKFKPDRAHHCRMCQSCVLKMDHHCPWIHNCVGFRNHKFFFLLLFYSVLSTWFVSITLYDTVKKYMHEVESAFGDILLTMLCETISTLLGLVITAFFCFHCGLAAFGLTTLEFCERKRSPRTAPSRHGDNAKFLNLKEVLGPNYWLWPFPVHSVMGDGLSFVNEKSRLMDPQNIPFCAKPVMRPRSLGRGDGADASDIDFDANSESAILMSGTYHQKDSSSWVQQGGVYGGTGGSRVDQISGAFGGGEVLLEGNQLPSRGQSKNVSGESTSIIV